MVNHIAWNLLISIIFLSPFSTASASSMSESELSHQLLTDSWTNFKTSEVVICQKQPYPFQCSSGTQIRIDKAIYRPSRFISNQNAVIQCPAPERSSESKPPTGCLKLKDITLPLKQLCEGKDSCSITPNQFSANESICSDVQKFIHLSYQCLPSSKIIQNKNICLDTYMELKCSHKRSDDVLVVLLANLVKRVDSNNCPVLIERNYPQADTCPTFINVSSKLQEMCNGERKCSVMPDPSMLPIEQPQICGKRHLQLKYACVSSKILEKSSVSASQRKSKQRTAPKPQLRRDQISNEAIGRRLMPNEKFQHMHGSTMVIQQNKKHVMRPQPIKMLDNNLKMDKRINTTELLNEELIHEIFPALSSDESLQLPTSTSMYSMIFGIVIGICLLTIVLLVIILSRFRYHKQQKQFSIDSFQKNTPNTPNAFNDSTTKIPLTYISGIVDSSALNNTQLPESSHKSFTNQGDYSSHNYIYLHHQEDVLNNSEGSTISPTYLTHLPYPQVWPGNSPSGPISNQLATTVSFAVDVKSNAKLIDEIHHLPQNQTIAASRGTDTLIDSRSIGYAKLSFSPINDCSQEFRCTNNVLNGNQTPTNHNTGNTNPLAAGSWYPSQRYEDAFSLKLKTNNNQFARLNSTSPHCPSFEANSTFSGNGSTESDHFSGLVSSNPSCSNVIRSQIMHCSNSYEINTDENNPNGNYGASSSPTKSRMCYDMNLSYRNVEQNTPSQWIGDDSSMPFLNGKNVHQSQTQYLPESSGKLQCTHASVESLATGLIEPPERFKNNNVEEAVWSANSANMDEVELLPPQMRPLQLGTTCNTILSSGNINRSLVYWDSFNN